MRIAVTCFLVAAGVFALAGFTRQGASSGAQSRLSSVRVPNVVGLSLRAAVSRLTNAGLCPNRISVGKGPATKTPRVVAQDPLAKASVPRLSKVDLEIARGGNFRLLYVVPAAC
jgi:beta-lactam-binding protein with PASTA domain